MALGVPWAAYAAMGCRQRGLRRGSTACLSQRQPFQPNTSFTNMTSTLITTRGTAGARFVSALEHRLARLHSLLMYDTAVMMPSACPLSELGAPGPPPLVKSCAYQPPAHGAEKRAAEAQQLACGVA